MGKSPVSGGNTGFCLSRRAGNQFVQIGKNPYVDKLAFKCGSYLPHAELPYTFVLGKRLKKGPEEYQDVLDAVMTDLCEAQKESEMLALKRKFKVEINQDVLKTVNCDGSN